MPAGCSSNDTAASNETPKRERTDVPDFYGETMPQNFQRRKHNR